LRKFLYVFAALLVVLVGVVLLGPNFIDWNSQKDRIAIEVRKETGRDLTIQGDMSLALLPAPALSAAGVSLTNMDGGSPVPMVELKELRVRVALLPLLQGTLQIEQIVLVQPTILLEILPDGRRNWDFPGEETVPSGPRIAEPTTTGMDVQFDDFSIEDGTVIYRDQVAGREERIEALNARIVAESLEGPFAAKGGFGIRGIPADIEGTIGRLAKEGATPFNILVKLTDAEARLQVSGALSIHPEMVALRGRLKGEGENLAAVVDAVSGSAGQAPAFLAHDFALQGEISADPQTLSLSEVELRLGATQLAGNATALAEPPYDARVSLTAPRIDLDRLMAAAAAQDGQAAGADGPSVEAGASEVSSVGVASLGTWMLPANVAGRLELAVDAVIYREQVVRQVRLDTALAEGRLTVERATALLPGSSDFSLTGDLASSDGQPQFSGHFEAASDNLRGLFDWVGVAVEQVPPDRLRRMGLSSRIEANADRIAISDIDLRVDLSRLSGGVVIAPRERPGFGIGIAIDSVNLDAYLPGPSAEQPGEETGEGVGAEVEGGVEILDRFDANLNLRVGGVTYRGATAKDLHVEATLKDGALELQSAQIGDLAGSRVGYAGTVAQLSATPVIDGTMELAVNEPPRLARLFGLAPENLAGIPAFDASAILKGDMSDLAVDARIAVMGGRLTLLGTARPTAQPPAFDLALSAEHPDFVGLAEALAGPLPLEPGMGELDLKARVTATAGRWQVSDLAATAGPASLSGGFAVDLGAATPVFSDLELTVAAKLPDVAGLAGAFGVPGLAPGTLGSLDIGGRLTGDQSALRIAGLTGQVGPAAVSGSIDLDLTGAGPTVRAIDLNVAAKHPNLAELAAALGGPEGLPPTLGGLDMTANVNGDLGRVRVEGLSGRFGPADVTGNLAADWTGARPAVAINLDTGPLPLDLFLGGGEDGNAAGGGRRWSRDPIDLSVLRAVDGEMTFKAAALTHGNWQLEQANLEASLNDGLLNLERFNGTLHGGGVQLAGTLDVRDDPQAGFALTAVEVDFGALLRAQAGFDRLSGPVSLDANFTAAGRSEAALVSSLAGEGDLSGQLTVETKAGEQAGGALLGVLGAGVPVVQGFAGAGALVLDSFAGKPAALTGTFTAERGIVRTSDTRLEGQGAMALTEADMDLPAWTINSQTDVVQAEAPQTPYLSVVARGPLDAPDITVGGLAFEAPSLPVVDQPAAPAPTAPAPDATVPDATALPEPTPEREPEPEPDQLIQDILKDLGG
jgi:uncharacterized protein involved in outer membrane biogenesis